MYLTMSFARMRFFTLAGTLWIIVFHLCGIRESGAATRHAKDGPKMDFATTLTGWWARATPLKKYERQLG